MPRFEPFPALRYDLGRAALDHVVAPPYDVIDAQQRSRLAARDPHNAVHIDLPIEEDGKDRYDVARCLLDQWLEDGVLVADEQPTLTVYRMRYVDDAGRPRHTTGVLGALELTEPGAGILPHEHTTPKAKSDRLELMRACRANLSAIWGLSLAKGLTELLPVEHAPLADLVDDHGVQHTVWVVDDAATITAIGDAVREQPVVIADGHHRYETALAYRREREHADGSPGAASATLAYLVELVDDELTVRAIHRLVSGLPADFDVVAALDPWFEAIGSPPPAVPITSAMVDAGALCAITAGGDVLLRPRADALADASDLDSSRLDTALAHLPPHQLTFQHGVENVRRAVAGGDAHTGVLLRPATVAQIEATAHGGDRMPPKTTFFHPKPKTGLVFRRL
jgi:uncharacterized protein (DUF1015 family)